jgi:hypothetical protein
VCRKFSVTRHTLDCLLVETEVCGSLRGVHRELVSEFLIALALDEPLEFT